MATKTFIAFDELPRGAGGVGATDKIQQVLSESDINVPVDLYDEALAMAREGRLAAATERLRMLLVLDPEDGEAALLLGKVLAARNRWDDSLVQLDAAADNGAIPRFFRKRLRNSMKEPFR